MNAPADEIRQMLARVSAGELDELSPAEIAQLEVALNEDDTLAAQLAEVPAGGDWPVQLTPSDTEWEAVWQGVSARTGQQRIKGWWLRPLGVAAAVVVLLGVWWSGSQHEAVDPWQIQPDTDFEIVSYEAGSDTTPFIMSGGEDEFPVIWVIDMEGA